MLLATCLPALGLILSSAACRPDPHEVTVGAAASLRGVMPDLISAFEAEHPGTRVRATFGASGDLVQQVIAGAPVDVVALAGAEPVDALVAAGLADAATRRVVATNTLVLVGPPGGAGLSFRALADAPSGEKVAVGDPRSVPAGKYAMEALRRLGQWDRLAGRLVYGNDVAAVLAYARRGEVAAAVVYKTDLAGISDVALLDELDPALGVRPEIVVALVRSPKAAPNASEFLGFVAGERAAAAFRAGGFGPRP